MNVLFASTAYGLEELLKNELLALGATHCKIVQGGLYFQGDDRLLYQGLLWSRLASRILLPLATFPVQCDQDLYLGSREIDWSGLFSVERTFSVHFKGMNNAIRNTQYGALKVKDAIVDHFIEQHNERPCVSKSLPDIRIPVFLEGDKAHIALDFSGIHGLHQRGYRAQGGGQAPLKENLAVAIILRSGWKQGTPLVDPMCGSGTLLIEAAMMATDQAPGLMRSHWGFQAWKGFNPVLWNDLLKEARLRAAAGFQNADSGFFGTDQDPKAISLAKENVRKAGLEKWITLSVQEVSQLTMHPPFIHLMDQKSTGTLICNPPYGERLSSVPELIAFYGTLGRVMKTAFGGWRASIFSGSSDLLSCLSLRAERQFKAKNGDLDCYQKNYALSAHPQDHSLALPAEDFAHRLHKNSQRRDKWAQKEGIECYRLYDADLPDYNLALDRYGDRVILQEYKAPKTIDEKKARKRLQDAVHATLVVLKLAPDQLVLKTRQPQSGKAQYSRLAQKGEFVLVKEYNARLWVNLTDYLDTGLFLDHRLTRKMLSDLSWGKDFLNLFAYTGSATVHAGLGGARSTTSVDMSHTYLEWAKKNLKTNGLTGPQHRFIQEDCLTWLNHQKNEQFDLVFLDPPTFSNSRRMQHIFEVERDYLSLIKKIRALLRPEGKLIFSCNKRGFYPDLSQMALLGFEAKDLSMQTESIDFTRRRPMHHCWLLTKKNKSQKGLNNQEPSSPCH